MGNNQYQKLCITLFFLKFTYLFLSALGLHCCTRAFSSCSERGVLFVAVRGLLTAVASLVAAPPSIFALTLQEASSQLLVRQTDALRTFSTSFIRSFTLGYLRSGLRRIPVDPTWSLCPQSVCKCHFTSSRTPRVPRCYQIKYKLVSFDSKPSKNDHSNFISNTKLLFCKLKCFDQYVLSILIESGCWHVR